MEMPWTVSASLRKMPACWCVPPIDPMPCEVTWEPQGVLRHMSAHVSGADLIRSTEAIQADLRFDSMRYVITDLTAVTSHGVTDDVLHEIAALHWGAHVSNPRCKIVFVSSDEALLHAIHTRLMDGRLASYEVGVAGSLDQARQWLLHRPPSRATRGTDLRQAALEERE